VNGKDNKGKISRIRKCITESYKGQDEGEIKYEGKWKKNQEEEKVECRIRRKVVKLMMKFRDAKAVFSE
jgi:hypothetical protein